MKKLSIAAILYIICLFSFTTYSQQSFLYPNPLHLDLNKPIMDWDDMGQRLFVVNSKDNDSISRGRRNMVKFILPFDSRFSRVSDPMGGENQWLKVFGLKIGLEIYKRFRFGFGFYELATPFIKDTIPEGGKDTLFSTVQFGYSTFFSEYALYNDFRWDFSITGQIGTGKIPVKLSLKETGSILYDSTFTVPVASIGIAAHYKFIPWFGIGAGIGYRKILVEDYIVNESFSKPFFAIKLKIFTGPLYKCIFRRDVIKAQREEYNRMRRKKQGIRDMKKEKKQIESDG